MMAQIFLSAVFWFNSTWFHPIHISVLEMEYDEKRKSLEMTQRVFLDDLEKEIMRERGREKVLFLNELSFKEQTSLVEPYLKDHLKVFINGSEKSFEYIGHELEGVSIFIYVEIAEIDTPRSIGVKNDILLAVYDDQINLAHLKVGEFKESLKMDRSSPTGLIDNIK